MRLPDGKLDDLFKALGSKSLRDFYDRAAYLGSDTETELTDDETDDNGNDVDDDANNDTDNDTSSDEDIDNDRVNYIGRLTDGNTFKTPIQPVLTKHPGFPNLKYLYIGTYIGIAKLRYFCRRAEGRDLVQNLF